MTNIQITISFIIPNTFFSFMILFKIVKFVSYALLNKMLANVKNILECNQKPSAELFYSKIKII